MKNIAMAFRVARYAKDEDFSEFVGGGEENILDDDLVCF